jgi:hypothetical protein
MNDVAFGISQNVGDIEAEHSLQPLQGGTVVAINHGRDERGTAGCWGSHGRLLIVARVDNI